MVNKEQGGGFSASPLPLSLLPLGWSCTSFREPKRSQDKALLLLTAAGAALGKAELQISGEPGRDLPDLDAFRVRKPLNGIFHHFGLHCL